MNNNRIRPTSTNLDVQSLIRRCEIAYDERARYVEFVCNVWNEGRFGPDLAAPVTIDLSRRPEPVPVSFLDRHETGQSRPNYPHPAILPPTALRGFLGRAGTQAVEAAFRRAKQTGVLASIHSNGNNITLQSASNQGRGSP